MNTITITSVRDVKTEDVYDLLISALEGGSNYWYMIQDVVWPKPPYRFADKLWASERVKNPDYINQCEVPFNEGGALMIDDERANDPELKAPVKLDMARIEEGLKLFANSVEYSHHWRDFISDNTDAITADVFLQFCIFGKVVYG